ncbi:LPXTG cell wall anchor domain-containing protein [Streptomyces sp. NPDC046203]|uniref:LPXTG cell wall anchor domain-containing protein n=1 Tax=Streptomyces sp. NPDC046203 TaxID=3154602 RepID=UPI003406BEE5
MKIRRIAATAVAAAVTAPALFLSAAPAFADTKPAAGASQTAQKSVEELRQAVADAQAEYDKAVVVRKKTSDEAIAYLEDKTQPLAVASEKAKQASKDAAAAKTAADAAVIKAEQDLAALPEDATEAEKAEARKAVDTAKDTAAAAKATADTKAAEAEVAGDAYVDWQVAVTRVAGAAERKLADAEKALDEAKAALASALAEEGGETLPPEPQPECAWKSGEFTAALTGAKEIARGSSAVYTYRLTNAGSTSFKAVSVYADVFGREGGRTEALPMEWAFAGSSAWKPVPAKGQAFSIGALASGKSVDLKLKFSIDAKSALDQGTITTFAEWRNDETTCGRSDSQSAWFDVVKAGKPGSGNGNGNGNGTNGGHDTNGSTGGSGSHGNGSSSPQGGSGTTPVNTTSTGGNLASTGAGTSTLPFALAGGTAVVLGAGAMVMVRRRKAGTSA